MKMQNENKSGLGFSFAMLAGCIITLAAYLVLSCASPTQPEIYRQAQVDRIPIILGAHPGDFSWTQERRYLDLRVVLYGAGNDEPGLNPKWRECRDTKVYLYGTLPHIIPIKAGNAYKWDEVYEQYCELNNDAILLGPQWIDLLEQPFKLDSKCGITGPAAAPRGGHIWIVFFCAMIRASLFREVGLLDPIFGIGAGEDTDFGIKVSQLGYHNYQVPIDAAPLVITDDDPDVSRGDFPLWHPGGATCSNIPEFKEAVLANTELLDRKYGK